LIVTKATAQEEVFFKVQKN